MKGCHEPYLQIFTHNLALSGSSRLLSRYAMPSIVFNCSTWSFIMASRARQATIESSSLLFITDLNTALLVERSDRRRIVYLICVSNARVLTKSGKIDQSEGENQILVYRNDLFPQAFSRFLSPALFLLFRALFSALRPD